MTDILAVIFCSAKSQQMYSCAVQKQCKSPCFRDKYTANVQTCCTKAVKKRVVITCSSIAVLNYL